MLTAVVQSPAFNHTVLVLLLDMQHHAFQAAWNVQMQAGLQEYVLASIRVSVLQHRPKQSAVMAL